MAVAKAIRALEDEWVKKFGRRERVILKVVANAILGLPESVAPKRTWKQCLIRFFLGKKHEPKS